jgi:DNA-binding IclR family transcriptional regulator
MLNDEPQRVPRYQDEVPAVARAIRLLERLTSGSTPCTLAELARELGVGPSSLLAILTTLRRAGLVSRDGDGRYQVGPGLAALGSAAACRLRACERFAAVADALVTALGETVLLWIRQDDTFVLAAAREGTQPLRYVPTPGLRLGADTTRLSALLDPAAGPDGEPTLTIEESVLPGVWTVAAALCLGSEERACVALAGPRDRLQAPEVRAALLAATGGADAVMQASESTEAAPLQPLTAAGSGWRATPTPPSLAQTAGPIEGAELDAFLGQSLVATLSYLTDDGYPATVPLWYAWDGSSFWLAPRSGSEWAEHVKLDPRVSLAVSESTPPLRRVLARGRLVEASEPSGARWSQVEAQLAGRYAGFDASREPASTGRGRLLELKPERLIAWRGLLRHPKLPPGPESPGSTSWRHLG